MPELIDVSPSRFSGFIWWVMIRGAESEQEVEKIRARLWRPPPGTEVTEGPWSAEAEMQAFSGLKASLGK